MNDEEMIRSFKGNLVDYITRLKETEEKYKKLQSNWNSLREWLEENTLWFDKELGLVEMEGYKSNRLPVINKYLLLDKMNELEKR